MRFLRHGYWLVSGLFALLCFALLAYLHYQYAQEVPWLDIVATVCVAIVLTTGSWVHTEYVRPWLAAQDNIDTSKAQHHAHKE